MKRKYMQQMAALLMLALTIFGQHAVAKEWYEGGTLHQAGALEWQQATYANKLATAGDLIATVYKSGKLVPALSNKIKSTDDVKAMAAALVDELDSTFAPNPNAQKNKAMLANQKVLDTAVLLMATAGWLKI